MLPSQDEINEVVNSILKGGTRYHSEKIAVVSVYVVVVLLSFVWAFSGFEIGSRIQGEFETQKLQNIDDQNFVLKNPSSTTWHDVRVVLNDRYLAKIDELKAGKRLRLKPTDFQYYFYVPRPWGQRDWERMATQAKPGASAPGDVAIETLSIHTREGEIDVAVKRDT